MYGLNEVYPAVHTDHGSTTEMAHPLGCYFAKQSGHAGNRFSTISRNPGLYFLKQGEMARVGVFSK